MNFVEIIKFFFDLVSFVANVITIIEFLKRK